MNLQRDRVPEFLSVLLVSVLFCRLAYFYGTGDAGMVSVVPDDAFYYLKLAINKTELGFWSFDAMSPASGFHLLYGYFLVLLSHLVPLREFGEVFLVVGVIASVSISFSFLLASKSIGSLLNKDSSIYSILPFFTAPLILQGTSMMESWLVILISSVSFYLLIKLSRLTFPKFVIFFLLGFLGVLARTDYGLIPGVLFCVFFVFRRRLDAPYYLICFVWLLGAVAGELFVMIHNYYLSGGGAQVSAKVKLHWSSTAGHSPIAILSLLVKMVIPFSNQIWAKWGAVWFLPFFACFAYVLMRMVKEVLRLQIPEKAFVLFAGCILICIGYVVFYSFNRGALQIWYCSNLILPLTIVISISFSQVFKNRFGNLKIVILVLYALNSLLLIRYETWPHQRGMLAAGLYLKEKKENEKVAAWNAGIIGYFSNKYIINIDGLTNDVVYPYIIDNDLFGYFIRERIIYVMDYSRMIDNSYLRQRGGYDFSGIRECMESVYDQGDNFPKLLGSSINLYKINLNCQEASVAEKH